MQESAYDAIQQLQMWHWWWNGMRRLYRVALHQFLPPNPKRYIIDIGCGFGANLPVLNPLGEVVGVDVELEALKAIESRPSLGLVQAHADALPFCAEAFDLIALLAVIEHLDDDILALRETYRVARPGAVQILLTSAFMLLWSHHDVVNNHRRRYRAHQLDARLKVAGWKVLLTSYVNVLVFPAALVVRLAQRWLKPTSTTINCDMGPDFGPFNRLLEWTLATEGTLTARWRLRMPFGVDLLSIAKRND